MRPFLLNDELLPGPPDPARSVLAWLREERGLTAAKDACREGECGACAVLLGALALGGGVRYRLVNACLLPLAVLGGRHLVTLEGLNRPDGALTPVQQALVEEGAIQCGYCTPGMVMGLTHWLLNGQRFDREEGLEALDGNLCRCTGYQGVKRALERLRPLGAGLPPAGERLGALVEAGVVPASFLGVAPRLAGLPPAPPALPTLGGLLVAGGTDLFAHPRPRADRRPLVFLDERPGLSGIVVLADRCRIGATTTLEDLLESAALAERLPQLHRALARFGGTPVRDRATLGGNLANASPIGDLSVCLLALGAEVLVQGPLGGRRVPLAGFFLGYKRLDLHPDELVAAVEFPLPPGALGFNFEKVAHREHLDVAAVNSALALELADGRIRRAGLSAGGVAPTPLGLAETSAWLVGRPLDGPTAWEAAQRAQREASPIDDVRGSAAYKRLLLRQLVLAHFQALGPAGMAAGWPWLASAGGATP